MEFTELKTAWNLLQQDVISNDTVEEEKIKSSGFKAGFIIEINARAAASTIDAEATTNFTCKNRLIFEISDFDLL